MTAKSIAVLILSQIATHGGWIWWNHGLPDNPLAAIAIIAGVVACVIIGLEIAQKWE